MIFEGSGVRLNPVVLSFMFVAAIVLLLLPLLMALMQTLWTARVTSKTLPACGIHVSSCYGSVLIAVIHFIVNFFEIVDIGCGHVLNCKQKFKYIIS